jgi:hypothetical protein
MALTNGTVPSNSAPATSSATSLSSTQLFFILTGLAFNAIQQRSGADEFPCPGSVSLARTSPLICAADVLIAFLTLGYGLWRGMRFQQSCVLYVRNMRKHLPDEIPFLENFRTCIDVGMMIPAFIAAFVIFAADGIDVRIVIWASMFISAPVVSGIARLVAESETARAEVQGFIDDDQIHEWLLQVSDLIWCAAYACQFTLWIQVFEAFSTLPRLSGSDDKYMNIAIGSSIIIAVIISATCKWRFYLYWSLQNWQPKQHFVALNVGFVLILLVGMPTDAESIAQWRRALFRPLGAFSIVVNMLWLVTLFEDLIVYVPEAFRRGSWRAVVSRRYWRGVIADLPLAPPNLQNRINPLLSTAPEYWRRTLMLNFAFCQVFFAVLNFVFVANSSAGTMPSWVSDLRR